MSVMSLPGCCNIVEEACSFGMPPRISIGWEVRTSCLYDRQALMKCLSNKLEPADHVGDLLKKDSFSVGVRNETRHWISLRRIIFGNDEVSCERIVLYGESQVVLFTSSAIN